MANPFMQIETVISVSDSLQEYKEYAYDFKTFRFIYDDKGRHIVVTRNEALKIWIKKALLTERYRYRAYFDDYGMELEHFIGSVPNDAVTRSDVFRYIEEGLLVNPYIKSVTAIDVKQENKKLFMTVRVMTVYGDLTVGMEV